MLRSIAFYGILLSSFYINTSICSSVTSEQQASSFNRTFVADDVYSASERGNLVSRADLPDLRILCIGASIMYGYLSSDGNGMRLGLRGALLGEGYKVHMIGSVSSGTMANNNVEGWPGARIDQLYDKAALSLPEMPNLVLIQAGTNDVLQNYDVGNIATRMEVLLNQVFEAVPNAYVVMAGLFPSASVDAAAVKANTDFKNLVARLGISNRVYFVDLHTQFFSTNDLHSDGIHPTDTGYLKMARVFVDGIQDIAAGISPPSVVAGLSDNVNENSYTAGGTCVPDASKMVGPKQIQRGSPILHDDGNYVHDRIPHTTAAENVNQGDAVNIGTMVRWADMNGDGRDDYIFLWNNHDITVAFADINADHRDDIICVNDDGSITGWLNTPGTDARHPNFTPMGVIQISQGQPGSRVRLGDVDGDGRVDYMIIADNGQITGWRNGGNANAPAFWQGLGVIYTIPTSWDKDGVMFVDMNGDGRDDLLWMGTNGQVTTIINHRGYEAGNLIPAWISAGQTHAGQTFPSRANYTFGRIWGSARPDYILSANAGSAQSWENVGSGGTTIKGDGVYYCDMDGDGYDDYIYIAPNGDMILFGNERTDPFYWNTNYPNNQVIHTIVSPRSWVHLADMDGDGRCEVIYVNPADGSFRWIRNDGFINGVWSYTDMGPSSGAAKCAQQDGIGINDKAVRFADLDGDGISSLSPVIKGVLKSLVGRADYLCIEPNTRTTGFLNKGLNNFQNVGQVKFALAGKDRANIRFHDVNGDGRADLLWIDKYTGQVQMYYNHGEIPSSGSSFQWDDKGLVFPGRTARGENVKFAKIRDSKASDYIAIQPDQAFAWVYEGQCGASYGGGGFPTLMVNPFRPLPTSNPLPISPSTNPTTDPPAPNPSAPNPADVCAPPAFFAPQELIGKITPKNDFCASSWARGIFPNLIEAQADGDGLRYIRIGFTDGSQIARGVKVADDGHHRYGTVQWDPWVDSFNIFSLFADGWDGGIGRILLEMTNLCGANLCALDAGKYWDSPPPENMVNRGGNGQGMLMSIYGASGDDIDGLQPYFSYAAPDRVILTDATFTPSFDELNSLPFEQRQMTVISDSHYVTNSRSETNITMITDLYLNSDVQTRVTYSHEGGREWGGEIGGTIGGEVNWEVGVPLIGGAGSKSHIDVTGKYVHTNIDKVIKGTEDSVLHGVQVRYQLVTTVKPGEVVRCVIVALQSHIDIRYKATLKLIFKDGTSYSYPVVGNFQNALASEAKSECFDIDPSNPDDATFLVNGEAIPMGSTITESGTYCKDGTRVGDIGMSDADLAAACPV